jgi:hypothetical protein
MQADRVSLVFASLFAALVSGPAWPQAGSIDPTCNGGVPVRFGVAASGVIPTTVLQLANNGVMGYGGDTASPYLKIFALTPDCAINTTFGTGGVMGDNTVTRPLISVTGKRTQSLPLVADAPLYNASVNPGGGIQVTRDLLTSNLWSSTPEMRAVDPTFGKDGKVVIDVGDATAYPTSMEALDDGRLMIQGIGGEGTAQYTFWIRLTSNGSVDTSYGFNGISKVLFNGAGYAGYAQFTLKDGTMWSTGESVQSNGMSHIVVLQRTADGNGFTPALGGGGFKTYSFSGANEAASFINILPDNNVLIAGNSDSRGFSLLIDPVSGHVLAPNLDDHGRTLSAAAHDTDYGYWLAKYVRNAGTPIIAGVERWNAQNGTITSDPSWSPLGLTNIPGLVSKLVPQADGKVYTALDLVSPAKTLTYDYGFTRLVGNSIAGTVTEFYNTILNHFFVTASAAEAASIDAGGSGPGWTRTGFTFKSGGVSQVCRFYGTPGLGPNSHFYTIDATECGNVKFDPGWHFESYDFSSQPPAPGGTCPAGTVPVYRAYNSRFAQNDSNHRLTTSLAEYNKQVNLGWKGEGVVMCAPS